MTQKNILPRKWKPPRLPRIIKHSCGRGRYRLFDSRNIYVAESSPLSVRHVACGASASRNSSFKIHFHRLTTLVFQFFKSTRRRPQIAEKFLIQKLLFSKKFLKVSSCAAAFSLWRQQLLLLGSSRGPAVEWRFQRLIFCRLFFNLNSSNSKANFNDVTTHEQFPPYNLASFDVSLTRFEVILSGASLTAHGACDGISHSFVIDGEANFPTLKVICMKFSRCPAALSVRSPSLSASLIRIGETHAMHARLIYDFVKVS